MVMKGKNLVKQVLSFCTVVPTLPEILEVIIKHQVSEFFVGICQQRTQLNVWYHQFWKVTELLRNAP